jgi:hypothetical protein
MNVETSYTFSFRFAYPYREDLRFVFRFLSADTE